MVNLLLGVYGDPLLLVGEQGPVLVPGDGRPGERLVRHFAVELEPAAGHDPLGVGRLQDRGRGWGGWWVRSGFQVLMCILEVV